MNKQITIISLIITTLLIGVGVLLAKTLQSSYAVSTTFADTIMSLASTNACNAGGTGVCATNSYTDNGTTKYHDYRFRGGDPNNYVLFNNDLYRIIGVFDENTHGIEGKYLVKLIRSKILGSYTWGVYTTTNTSKVYKGYANDWTGNTTGVKANLNILLNEFFYNKTDTSSIYGACSDWTYFVSGVKTFSCSSIIRNGIDDDYRDYIEEVTWYLNGYNSREYSKQNFYLCERGLSTDTTNCMSGNSGVYAASTTGKIGLMYVSDLLYASSNYSDAATNTSSSEYFGTKNWLYRTFEWTISPQGNATNNVFYANSVGGVQATQTRVSNAIRPSFYLKSNVIVTGGTGTFNDPYKLSM